MKKLQHRKHHFLIILLLIIFMFSHSSQTYAVPLSNDNSFFATHSNYNILTIDSSKTYGIIINNFSNIYGIPSFSSKTANKVYYGNFVEVLTSNDKWCKIKFLSKVGYIPTSAISVFSDAEKYLIEEERPVGRVSSKSLNIRNFPTTSKSTIIGKLKLNTYVDVLAQLGDWYQIQYEDSLAFVSASCIELVDGLTAGRVNDIDYSNTFTEVIQSYTITHSSSKNRDYNLAKAAQIINGDTSGYILYPGSKFDWFYVIGDPSKEKGFLEAGIILNKVASVGYGGGCCEVASTLNSAMIELGIPTNAHSHSVPQKYLKNHHEATVSFDSGLNFSFINTFDYSIKLEVTTDAGNVTVNVYKVP